MQEGLFELARAICRQWVYDGKPDNGKQTVKTYAYIMQQMRTKHNRQWYKQARALLKGVDIQVEDEEETFNDSD